MATRGREGERESGESPARRRRWRQLDVGFPRRSVWLKPPTTHSHSPHFTRGSSQLLNSNTNVLPPERSSGSWRFLPRQPSSAGPNRRYDLTCGMVSTQHTRLNIEAESNNTNRFGGCRSSPASKTKAIKPTNVCCFDRIEGVHCQGSRHRRVSWHVLAHPASFHR